MKRHFSPVIAFALTSSCILAQTANQGPTATGGGTGAGTSPQGTTTPAPSMEGIMKQGARLAMIRGGTMSLVEKSMTLPNGLRVDPDGTITFPDRTQTMLQPNQMVTMAGMVVPLPPGMPTGGGSRDQTQATKKSTETSAPVIKAGDGTGAR